MPAEDESTGDVLAGRRTIGELGLKEHGGIIAEDYIPKLKTLSKRIKTFREMREDPVIGSILFAIEMHLRKPDWHAEGEDEELVELVEDCMTDMSHTWQDLISEILSMLPYGFSVHEIVYKIRDDGRIGWKKLPIRSQDSIERWDFDDEGGLNGVYQRRWSDGKVVHIPIEKMLLFRPTSHKNNPEGRSVLRTAYKAYYYKKKLETIEAIGIERDLSGYPVLNVPEEVFGESERAQKLKRIAENIVTRIRKDEQMGSVLPPNWELDLLSSTGSAKTDVGEVISRYSVQIAQSLLSDIIHLGHQRSGSYALSEQKYDLFVLALNSWMDSIAEVFNNYAIPRLMKLNGIEDEERYPELVPDRVGDIDEQKLANTIFRLSGVHAIEPDDKLEDYLRNFLGLPQKDEDSRRDPNEGRINGDDNEDENGNSPSPDNRQRTDNNQRPPDTAGEYNQETTDHTGID